MRKQNIYGPLFFLTLVFCLSWTPSAIAASPEEEVLQVIINQDNAMNTSDFELLSSLWWHSPKASFFGPIKKGSFLSQGWEEIAKLLKETLDVPAGTYNFLLRHPQVTMLGDNAAVITLYHVRVRTDPETKEKAIGTDRFTNVLQKIDGKWLIVHCHISDFPS
jgi:ketosteroid isomerase-like protein